MTLESPPPNLKKSYSYHELTPLVRTDRFERYLKLCDRCKGNEPIEPNRTIQFYLQTEMINAKKVNQPGEENENSIFMHRPVWSFNHEWIKGKFERYAYDFQLNDSIDEDLPMNIYCDVWKPGTKTYRHEKAGLNRIDAVWSQKRMCGPSVVYLGHNRKVKEVSYRLKSGATVDKHHYTRDYEITHLRQYYHHKVVNSDREFLLEWYKHFVAPSLNEE